ncbi:STAS domain-containing protein [Kitasatospora sp. NBC_01287]|uniref:STAS domain-containing protein n=1 Tax=Kitasatospora sp. NBC_01287 TaxID=2903573 RepID=UPI00224C8BC8|nr:STAS domain-containing protein [Kitasatospora sp. NBC_01287]MCX4746726.1 STAS domain-containing protein [Kitasatospora sp. NBC_01287]
MEYPGLGGHAVLALEGRLDVRSAADARARLHQAVDGGAGDLVLDLRALDSWDATGLGVIMGTHRRAGRLGRRLVLREVPPQLQRLLVATRLHRILAVEGAVGDPCGATLPGGPAGQPALPSVTAPSH